jgi:hypothetical protein
VLQQIPPAGAALKIAALKQQKLSPPPASEEFDYDPNEPLRLVKPGKSGMDR